MYRFLAFTWNPIDAEQNFKADQLAERILADSHSWETVYDKPGLRVFDRRTSYSTYRAYLLGGGGGVVLGKLFCRESSGCNSSIESPFGAAETMSIVRGRGRVLVDRYWGHYVLFLRETQPEALHVLRDPTGALPCYIVTKSSPCVFLSNVEDLTSLQIGRLSVNWTHVAGFFIHNRLVTESTGLRDVSLLSAGQCLTMNIGERHTGGTRRFYWSPAEISDRDMIDDASQARTQIRGAILRCVSAWGACYQSVLHELSGGLDSSIVAAALGARPQPCVTCFHYFTDTAAGDEREYARSVAGRFKYRLVEQPVSVAQRTLVQQLSDTRLATPALLGFLPESETAKKELVESMEAGAVFTGQGGDHLFQHGKNDLIAAEALRNHGIGMAFFRAVLDSSRTSDQSIWSVLQTSWQLHVGRLKYDPYASFLPPSILSSDAQGLGSRKYTHPWISMADGLPASKVKLIFALIDTQLFYLRPYCHADRVHPLLSQPIVECCLQIPSYLMALGGVSRGLVREAFRDSLPVEVVNRRSKGTTTSYFNNLLLQNLPAIRELLLDGRLVQERLLDRAVLEKELSQSRLIGGREVRSVLNAVRAEAWVQAWGI